MPLSLSGRAILPHRGSKAYLQTLIPRRNGCIFFCEKWKMTGTSHYYKFRDGWEKQNYITNLFCHFWFGNICWFGSFCYQNKSVLLETSMNYQIYAFNMNRLGFKNWQRNRHFACQNLKCLDTSVSHSYLEQINKYFDEAKKQCFCNRCITTHILQIMMHPKK